MPPGLSSRRKIVKSSRSSCVSDTLLARMMPSGQLPCSGADMSVDTLAGSETSSGKALSPVPAEQSLLHWLSLWAPLSMSSHLVGLKTEASPRGLPLSLLEGLSTENSRFVALPSLSVVVQIVGRL
eukprot:scaffold3190_cov409-Prasinococcus_capsulatus_cf.AAC.9